jgi:hypothetical protein
MLLKGFGLAIFIASIALVSSCSGQEDGIVEVILIDGPGGYLPDIDVDEDIGNEVDFVQAPIPDEGYYRDQFIMQRYWLNFLNYWANYLSLLLG